MSEPPIGQAVARGATAMVGVTLLTKLLASFGQLVIAMYVMDEEFGRWALALSLAEMFGIVNKLGLREILTHRQKNIDEWVSSALWAAALGGILTLAVIGAIAPFAPRIFNSAPEFAGLLLVAGIGFASIGFSDVFQAKLAVEFRFGVIAKIAAAEGVVRIAAQIGLSVLGMGAMGLVLARSVTWVAQAVALGIAAKPKIKLNPEFSLWKRAYSDCSNIFVIRIAEVVIRRSDVLLLGLFVGDAVVGMYYFAFGLSTQVIMLLAQSLTGALAAGLSKLQDDVARLRKAFLSVVRLITFIGVPLLVTQAAACGPLLRFLYEDKWEGAIAPLQILSVAGCIAIAGWNTNAVFTARGLFRRQLVIRVVGCIVYLAAMLVAASGGNIIAVATTVLVYRMFYGPVQIALATDGGWKVAGEVILAILRPFNVAGVGAILAVLLTSAVDPAILGIADIAGDHAGRAADFLRLVLISSVTLGLYYVGARMLLGETYREFAERTRTILPARIADRVPSWLL